MTATTTIAPLSVETAALDSVLVDIYRDIHKGIRNELFAVTFEAGRVDPLDHEAVATVSSRWGNLVQLLIGHAQHEDEFVLPVIERFTPEYAEEITVAHTALEHQMAQLELLADRAADSCPERGRILGHRLYLGLASFTAAYLQHQEFEEFEVMVMLSQHVSPEDLRALDHAIVASLTPEQMAQSMPLMLPAMNIEDQAELLGGVQAGAPAEVFAGMMGMTESVLEPARYAALAHRLGV
jgi:iron-sulfur cluster repair protein YtfE (RIC family)